MSLKAGLALLMCAALASGARGQVVLSAGAASDYRFRGVSLNNGRPDLRLSLDFDHSSGCYAGATVTAAEFYAQRRQAEWLGYGGCARRWDDALSWEVGATAALFGQSRDYDYGEVYAGLSAEHWNLRSYFSPSYFGRGRRTAYLEFNVHLRIDPVWQLVGHLGALELLGRGATNKDPVRFDWRLGVGRAVGDVSMELSWVHASQQGIYPVSYSVSSQALVLSATYPF